MTLVSPTADIREGAARRDDPLRRRACTVFESCATVSPPTLPALASAFAEYLLAWRETSPDDERPASPAAPQRLHELVARLDSILRRAEQAIDPSPPTPPHLSDDLARLEDEAAKLLAETRELLRSLDADRPATQRARLSLVAAWGRYDDALAVVRTRAAQAPAADPGVMAGVRDALLKQLESARALCARSAEAHVNGGRVQR
jgi:hypothetical protein